MLTAGNTPGTEQLDATPATSGTPAAWSHTCSVPVLVSTAVQRNDAGQSCPASCANTSAARNEASSMVCADSDS